MKINVNNMCRVKLTPFGIGVLLDEKFQTTYRFNMDKKTHIITTELWNLMSIFGPYLFNGAVNLPFDQNEIEILEEN